MAAQPGNRRGVSLSIPVANYLVGGFTWIARSRLCPARFPILRGFHRRGRLTNTANEPVPISERSFDPFTHDPPATCRCSFQKEKKNIQRGEKREKEMNIGGRLIGMLRLIVINERRYASLRFLIFPFSTASISPFFTFFFTVLLLLFRSLLLLLAAAVFSSL